MKPVLFLVGCTASGKKRVAQALAEPLRAELLSLDALKVYSGMDRGTDKAGVGAFALTNLVPATESFSVGRYVEVAAETVTAIQQRQHRALFVGGTGLYLRALVRGLFDGPPIGEEVRHQLEQEFDRRGAETLYQELQEADPACAARVHPNDRKRVVRALEVFRETGRPLTEWQRERTRPALSGPFVLVGIRWQGQALRRRIEARVDRMLDAGLVDEVRALSANGQLGRVAAQAIGYREVLDHLAGKTDLATCRRQVFHHTWQFSRNQDNWFRQFPEIQWVEAGQTSLGPMGAGKMDVHEEEDRLRESVLDCFLRQLPSLDEPAV